jgi:2,3-dihydroxybenzoate decarboxylase
MSPVLPKIALEEHFIIPSFMDYLMQALPAVTPDMKANLLRRLADFGEERLAAMDSAGVVRSVLSISGPGVQIEPDTAKATKLAAAANDRLAKEVAERPARYSGFAHVAMQDPKGAADELERCVRALGFSGVMINHHTNGVYLDDPRNDVFWERLEALGVPLYLHPGDAFEMPHVLRGVPELNKPVWEWTTEMSAHALRLVMTGVFDRFPRADHPGAWRRDTALRAVAPRQPLCVDGDGSAREAGAIRIRARQHSHHNVGAVFQCAAASRDRGARRGSGHVLDRLSV